MAWDRDKERKAGKAMSIGSSVFGLLFAIFWCVTAASMEAWFLLIFGILFVGMMVYRIYVLWQYAKGDGETSPAKETEPWDRPAGQSAPGGSGFCPYCGGPIQEGFAYCPKCGRKQA